MILNKKTSSVLVIAGDYGVQNLIAEYLADVEIGFSPAPSVPEASKLLKENKFELILLDIHHNSVKDYNTLKKVSEELNIKTPVVVLVDEIQEEEMKKYFNLGISGCLSKPVSKMDLAGIMTQFLPDFTRHHS